MRIILTIFLVVPIWAQLSIDDLKQRLDQGGLEADLMPIVQSEGIAFPVNLKHLKAMKKAGFPDYLIDGIVELYGPHRVPKYEADYNRGGGSIYDYELPYFSPYYHPTRFGLWPYWGLNSPWGFFSYSGFPFVYGSYYNYYSLYWGPLYWGVYGSGLPGNSLSPHGFRNLHDDRIRARAVRRNAPKSPARTKFNRSRGNRSSVGSGASSRGGSRGSSSSRSSSSGSRAVRK